MDKKPINPLQSQKALRVVMDDYWQGLAKLPAPGSRKNLVAWCTALTPTDLLLAFDFTLVFPENHAAVCGAQRVGTDLCEVAEGQGYSQDLCSYARNDLGSALAGAETKSPVGGLPKPDLLLACSNSCDTVTKWFEAVGRVFNVPVLILDVPFLHNSEYSTGDEAYVVSQLKEMITFLEGFTGRKLDYDVLSQKVDYSNQALTLWKAILKSCCHRPSPMTIFDGFFHMFPIVTLRGTKEAVDYYSVLLKELDERIGKNVGAIVEEKYRLYWDNITVWPRLSQMANKFASKGACLLTAAYLHNWSFSDMDPEKPLESIARACSTTYINRGVDHRVNKIVEFVQDYDLDGLVVLSARTCKPFFVGQYEIIEQVAKITGVPSVVIEGDMVDSRLYSDAQADVRIDAFLELLEKRKSA